MCTSRGLDDARRLCEPSEAGSVDLVVLRDEGRNTSADIWREPVDAEPLANAVGAIVASVDYRLACVEITQGDSIASMAWGA